MNLAEKFAKQNGIEWHEPHDIKEWSYYLRGVIYWTSIDPEDGTEPCIRTIYPKDNPTFSHPEEVLAVCQKWDDYRAFIVKLVSELKDDGTLSDMVKSFIETYITTEGKLLSAAVEWRDGRGK